jgi:hypothetical protein
MKKYTLGMGAICIILLQGCATSPENIPPSYISDLSYNNWSCEQIAQEQPRLVAALASSSDAQRRCRSNDIAGVILLGLPVSSLSGSNMASEVARLKGEVQAIQRAAILKNCQITPVEIEIPPPQTNTPATTASTDSEGK